MNKIVSTDIDHDDWSELNVPWDDLNQAIADFYVMHDRCTDSGSQQMNEVHMDPGPSEGERGYVQPCAAQFRASLNALGLPSTRAGIYGYEKNELHELHEIVLLVLFVLFVLGAEP
jgi:hypothetical protein